MNVPRNKNLLVTLLIFTLLSGRLSAQDRPNILWISVEDIGPMLAPYGDSTAYTPNINWLANEGVVYENAYATVGVCAPSRSSIITGMYPTRIGTHNMRTGAPYGFTQPENESYKTYYGQRDILNREIPQYSAVPPEYVKCFTEYLREGGYFTSNNDKCDYQFNSPITAWDENGSDAHYLNREKNQPFFSVFNRMITHESRVFMKENDLMLVDTSKLNIPGYFPDIPIVRRDLGRVYSNIMELDSEIGDILDTLRAHKLLNKTIIILWSDHGGPLLRQKRAIGNSGLRVPLIIRYPDGHLAGTRDSSIVSLMDLGPTVLSLAGINPPSYMDGKAFAGPFKSVAPRKYSFGSADRFDEAIDMSRSVIDGRFVYIKNFRPQLPLLPRIAYREQVKMNSTLIEMNQAGLLSGDHAYMFMKTKPVEELYDLLSDPYELKNLAQLPGYDNKLGELRNALASWQMEIGDLGFVPEYDLIQMMWPGLKQPKTSKVVFVTEKDFLQLKSDTKGASIAYQINEEIGGDKWRLYHGNLKSQTIQNIVARAVRLGYKTSEITSWHQNEKTGE
ncbi:sulfatase family protein [Algoriphagus hitonicola]|uniref:Arylsulfatase A n=1 Tax=Algoriphagus hitonicola TaxID=435880 RepID=A0A1I2T4Y4_9BACT|nr:sulfatase [Algoriphagus hitonicola]SFG57271.1 Arylsulfatase A [Algoriphagus hitonicola]